MKTNCIKGNLELYERIERLEEENNILKEQVNDCIDFIRILEQWFKDGEDRNNNNSINIDCGTYEL
jgi:hypothetical protein